MITLDMTGKPCPLPMVHAKQVLTQPESDGVSLLVDDMITVQNLHKMAEHMGYFFSYTASSSGFLAVISQKEPAPDEFSSPSIESTLLPKEDCILLITKDQLGTGDHILGSMLLRGLIFSLTELSTPPKAILFMDLGIHLVIKHSAALHDLQILSERGCEILACATSLNYYATAECLAVGKAADMFYLTRYLTSGIRVVSL